MYFLAIFGGSYNTNFCKEHASWCGLWEADSDPTLYSLLPWRLFTHGEPSYLCQESRLVYQAFHLSLLVYTVCEMKVCLTTLGLDWATLAPQHCPHSREAGLFMFSLGGLGLSNPHAESCTWPKLCAQHNNFQNFACEVSVEQIFFLLLSCLPLCRLHF